MDAAGCEKKRGATAGAGARATRRWALGISNFRMILLLTIPERAKWLARLA